MSEIKDRIYVSTACLKEERDIATILSKYGEAGLRNVEISGNLSYKPMEELVAILRHFKSCGMNFIFHNYFPPPQEPFVLNILSTDDKIQERSRQLISAAINLARKIGVNLYCFHPGYLGDPLPGKDGKFIFSGKAPVNKDSYFKLLLHDFMSYYETLNLEDTGQNCFIGLENLFPFNDGSDYTIFSSMEDISRIFEDKKVYNTRLGILLDLGHVELSCRIFNIDRDYFVNKIIERFSDRIYEIHLSENDGKEDMHGKIREDSWQFRSLGRFLRTNKGSRGVETRFCIESRGLTVSDIISSYEIVKRKVKELS